MADNTAFKKKWENYWYYYKWHTFAAIFILFLAAFFVKDLVFAEKFDITVTIAVQGSVFDDQQQNLKANFEKYAEDINGDGKVNVGLNIISFPNNVETADPQVMTALSTRLMAEFSLPDSHIYIFDKWTYERIFHSDDETANFAVDLAKTYGGKKGIDGYKYKIAQSPLAEGEYVNKLKDNWFLVMRGSDNSVVNKSSDSKKYYEANKRLMDKLMQQAE